MADDRSTKLGRLRAILDARDSVSLRRASVATLSWLLDGARSLDLVECGPVTR